MKNTVAMDLEEFRCYEETKLIEQILQILGQGELGEHTTSNNVPRAYLRFFLIKEGFVCKYQELIGEFWQISRDYQKTRLELLNKLCKKCGYDSWRCGSDFRHIINKLKKETEEKEEYFKKNIGPKIIHKSILIKGKLEFKYITEWRLRSEIEKYGDPISYEFYFGHMGNKLVEEVNQLSGYIMLKYDLNGLESLSKIIDIVENKDNVKIIDVTRNKNNTYQHNCVGV